MTRPDVRFLPADDCINDYEESVKKISVRRVLRTLISAERPLSPVELMNASRISIPSTSFAIKYLLLKKVIEINQGDVFITRNGRIWAIKNRKKIFFTKINVIYKSSKISKSKDIKEYDTPPKWLLINEFEEQN